MRKAVRLCSVNPLAIGSSRFPRSFHVVAKPTGRLQPRLHLLLLSHKEDLLPDRTPGRITDDLLEKFIRQYIAGQEDEVVFNWHGGEPALLGLDFFRKVVELQRKYAGTMRIENDFQTNGALLDESWCEFFKEHRFYVGLSIDGPNICTTISASEGRDADLRSGLPGGTTSPAIRECPSTP